MYPALYRFAFARLDGRREAAEDVAQTTLYRAIGKLQTYRGEASFLTWLCTFCRHEIFAHAKAHRHRSHIVPIDDAPEIRAALESLQAVDEADPIALSIAGSRPRSTGACVEARSTRRGPAFHRLDLRLERQFALFGKHTSLFADVQNVYNHQSVITYEWNQKTRELHAEKQLGFLPVVGINVEF
jgi:hypothetical protein